ncbi:TPX2-like isoform X2 [Olea europaea subsp. europaea]|uniref:TPX2-like isoform X2 n=1 Tax=Olea europaea subsp. europaea TaxID=158383 RepID=A0A8S0TZ99_OLEEU|nr:TPX2-like isoform X2 [Olea europaea subsp. europaea]
MENPEGPILRMPQGWKGVSRLMDLKHSSLIRRYCQAKEILEFSEIEFNFRTEKRVQHNPPIELLNKLSLTSDQLTAGSRTKLPLPISLSVKGSKENRWSSFQQEHEIKQVVKQKVTSFQGKQIQCSADGRKEVGPVSGINGYLICSLDIFVRCTIV